MLGHPDEGHIHVVRHDEQFRPEHATQGFIPMAGYARPDLIGAASAKDGSFVMAWEEEDAATSSRRLVVGVHDAAGRPLWEAEDIASRAVSEEHDVSMHAHADGHVTFLWKTDDGLALRAVHAAEAGF